jgi:hypothetical protein
MSAIKKDQAVSKLITAIHAMQLDDIAEVCNELFPESPTDTTRVKEDPQRFQKQVFDYIDKGLEVEEILDLWRVVFPKDRRVRFNEETSELTYEDQEFLYAK